MKIQKWCSLFGKQVGNSMKSYPVALSYGFTIPLESWNMQTTFSVNFLSIIHNHQRIGEINSYPLINKWTEYETVQQLTYTHTLINVALIKLSGLYTKCKGEGRQGLVENSFGGRRGEMRGEMTKIQCANIWKC